MERWYPAIFCTIIFAWGLSTSWERHARYELSDWRSDLRADAAGYYVYLPAVFNFGFRASGVDTTLLERAGHGFRLNMDADRVQTKYPCGTALLQLPFYVVAESIAGWGTTDGFTSVHQRAVESAAVFYWALALLLLWSALHAWCRPPAWALAVVLLGISFGTNVFFYAVRQPGYSHIYSFFAVSLAIWALITRVLGTGSRSGWWIFHAACALILLIRAIDIIAVAGLYAWVLAERAVLLRDVRFWAGQVGFCALFALPQLTYWKHAFGSWIIDSYPGETFAYWYAPHIVKELFSPNNGLLPYAPFLLLLPPGLIVLHRSKRHLVWIITGVLLLMVYACASWWAWDFGCGYGCRPAVQYMPFVAIGTLPFITSKDRGWVRARSAVLPVLALLVYIQFRSGMEVIPCFAGKDIWDWGWYTANALRPFAGSAP
jgi:hypothetical protein